MENRILIAEDEPKLRAILCDYFRSKGDVPAPAADGLQALELAENDDFDAILLDIMMPGLDGFAVCRAVRRRQDTPIHRPVGRGGQALRLRAGRRRLYH